jgi:hypothetical protein
MLASAMIAACASKECVMNGGAGHRHRKSRRQKASDRKRDSPKKAKLARSMPEPGQLFAFTIDPHTAQIVRVETVDTTGDRRELSNEEKAKLLPEDRGRLEEVLEQAFEAGIACALGDEARQDGREESAEEAELRHLLLSRLIEHSAARHLMGREQLSQAIVDTLIQLSIEPSQVAARGRAARATHPAPTASGGTN